MPAQICHRRLVCQACVPLSPLSLPYSPFVSSSVSLLLPAAAAWLGFLFCSTMLHRWKLWVLLFWKECASMWLPKSLSGDLGGQSPKMWFRTSFGPRLHLVRTSLKLQPVKTQPGEVLGRLCHGLLLGLLLLLLLLLVLLLLGKARFLGGEPRDLWRAGSCAEETKSIRRLPENSIRSAVCHGEVDERIDWHEAEFIIETTGMWRFVGWKCHETWCAMRRMIVLTVQAGIWLPTLGYQAHIKRIVNRYIWVACFRISPFWPSVCQ